ncbi:hypothetical protein Sbal625DRAFT_4154 [Shewanella baltica OS625]|uniref:hypothetical protein n=1 Tax=Shewanella baltica TaxID=62322 RepID=UPI000230DF08|nr:hypothetical protein [Shewanella baltica]EHC04194.1 hypothetical protein Sbal625DRAFT_4154 [Shewanella baltica OS625]
MTHSITTSASHTKPFSEQASLQATSRLSKDDISKTKNTIEMLIAFTEIELTLAVAKARYALIDSEEDDYIYGGTCQDSFSAGVEFGILMNEFVDYARCSRKTLKIQLIINDIQSLISTMPKVLKSEFKFGQAEMNMDC